MGKILRIYLERKKAVVEPLNNDVIKRFIGGRGLGAWILWSELSPNIDPLDPENKLVIVVGPLSGTKALGAHRWMAQFKSPLTGTYFRSVGGGFFGAELKFAGYDAIVIEGKAEKPTYFYVNGDSLEFRDASRIWGMTTNAVRDFLKDETERNARMVMIGPAGENLVKMAALVTDDMRTASRGGGGVVMGSKNLKAIVVRGSKKPEIYDESLFNECVKEQIESYKKSSYFESFHDLGTNSAVYVQYLGGCFPPYNYKQQELSGVEAFKPENLANYIVKHYGCYGCMIRCGKVFKLTKGPYAGIVWDSPEYETHWSFGSNLGNVNIESITYANMLADEYGLDTISTGVAIGFAMELYEKGVIDKNETGGIALRWGDPDIIPELVRKIALRLGIGNILAEGVRKAAEIIGRGSSNYAMHVKGLEMPAHEPRRAKACGLSMMTSPIGATHTMSTGLRYEEHEFPYKGKRVDPFTTEGKGQMTKCTQDETALFDTGIWCSFALLCGNVTIDLYSKFLFAATGIEEFKDPKYLLLIGERIFNVERAFNAMEDICANYDKMPERIVKEPISRDCPAKGQIFEEEILLSDYYKARGWDKRGIPSKKKLLELDLEDISKKLGF